MYDYGARNYDPAIGRWMNIDALAENGYSTSPYNYGLNNPISVVDVDGLYPLPILVYNKASNSYHLTNAASHLLSLVSGIDKRKIQNAEIKMRGAGHYVPFYIANDGGGAITLGRPAYQAIYYTENWFDDNKRSFNNHGYGQDINRWLRHLSHEVGHLDQIDLEGGLTSYSLEMLMQFTSVGFNHDSAPYEQQADIGQNEFIAFNSFIALNYGENSLADLFTKHKDTAIVNTINNWWSAYETFKGNKASRTQSFLEGLQTNLNNYSAGMYIYNGTNWVIKN